MKKWILLFFVLFSVGFVHSQISIGRAYDEITGCTLFDECVGYAYRHGNPSTSTMANEIKAELMATYGVSSGSVITNSCGSCSALVILSFSYTIPGYTCTKNDYTYGFGNNYNEALDEALDRKSNLGSSSAAAPYQIAEVVYTSATATIKEAGATEGANIYPNPAQSELFVDANFNNTINQVLVYGTTGTSVFSSPGSISVIDVSTWPAGIYTVNLVYKNGRQEFKKVIVNH